LPTTIGIIEDEAHRYLLLRRAQEPRRGYWDTVGGFLSSDERAEECLAREAREEIGSDLVELAPLGTYSSVYGTTGLHTIGIAFLCRLRPGSRVRLSAENSEYRWFPAAELPELAFPDGRQALKDAIGRRGGWRGRRSGEAGPPAGVKPSPAGTPGSDDSGQPLVRWSPAGTVVGRPP